MYRAQTDELHAALHHGVAGERLWATARFAEATPETLEAVFTEAGRLAQETLAPLNRVGDVEGATLENGVVRTPDGFKPAYREIADGVWNGLAADPEFGGAGLPLTAQTAVNELFASACLSLSLCPLLTQGAIDALSHHGTPEQKALYLPKLISGVWNGTMNLTEPQAGTDVGALRTTATPQPDGAYRINGSKIWISWGDNDLTENVVHLVLARLPDAPSGARGVSLFVAPKFLPDAEGRPGARNGVSVVSLEGKMGLHASPTCVMAYDDATAWLVGEPNKGMSAMFTMMNNARLGVGVEGVAIAEAATQKAEAFALERRQGRTPVGGGAGAIVEHADVRRMLLLMRAQTMAARALCFDCALSLDLAVAAEDPDTRAREAALGAFLTPLAKAYGTDTGCEVAHLGVQVHGGAGFVEETGAAQFSRDVRVTAIYEGTNGVQAMDLVGRKLADGGEAAGVLLDRAAAEAQALSTAGPEALRALAEPLRGAVDAARQTTGLMVASSALDRQAGGVAYLRLMSQTLGAATLLRIARRTADPARVAQARVYVHAALSTNPGLAAAATMGAEPLYAVDNTVFAA